MKFKDKYTTISLKEKDKTEKEASKTEISEDAFAIGDIIDSLINKIEQVRVTNIR